MEQQTETKEISPCFDIDKVTEDTREALLILNLHYFSKVLEENEKLKQTSYLCAWECRNETFYKIVVADTKEKAIMKLLLMDETHFIWMLIVRYNFCVLMGTIDVKKQKIFNKCASYGLLIDRSQVSPYPAFDLNDSLPDFHKKYKEFILDNLDDMIYVVLNTEPVASNIIKIDDKVFIK